MASARKRTDGGKRKGSRSNAQRKQGLRKEARRAATASGSAPTQRGRSSTQRERESTQRGRSSTQRGRESTQRKRPATARSGEKTRVPTRLREYRERRDFAVTTEPAPAPLTRHAGPPTFMIHKHDATRLHYDLRLEMGGALASWSVPKGPSFDPAIKRLAIQTEDHPLEYGGFEGRIPDGEYGAGDSLIWERGVYETVPPGEAEAQRRRGRMHLVLMGDKLRGGWHLVRTGRPVSGKAQWLLFKARDTTADPRLDIVAERP